MLSGAFSPDYTYRPDRVRIDPAGDGCILISSLACSF